MVTISLEELRFTFKPDPIRVLFIGESPPAGGTFFYKADSNLFRYTQEAFSNVYDEKCGLGTDFLRFFKSIGCYLDDLCLEPINKLDKPTRLRKRSDAVPSLAERIRVANPRSIVVVMKAIMENVQEAIDITRIDRVPTYYLPFPAQSNQRKYVNSLIATIQRLRETTILP
ncbi:MAG: hypothetical protein RX318_11095 [bacterium]|nr:hypothetical protein [bacterium]